MIAYPSTTIGSDLSTQEISALPMLAPPSMANYVPEDSMHQVVDTAVETQVVDTGLETDSSEMATDEEPGNDSQITLRFGGGETQYGHFFGTDDVNRFSEALEIKSWEVLRNH